MWFTLVGVFNGAATFLLYAALGLGSITLVAPLVALFPLIAVGLSLIFLRGERLPMHGPARRRHLRERSHRAAARALIVANTWAQCGHEYPQSAGHESSRLNVLPCRQTRAP